MVIVAVNTAMLLSMPVEGTHYLADILLGILLGILVAAVPLAITYRAVNIQALPAPFANKRESTPAAAKAPSQRSSAGVSYSNAVSPGVLNQPCRVISASSCPSPQPA